MIKYYSQFPSAFNNSVYTTTLYPPPSAPNLISGLSAWFVAGTNQNTFAASGSISVWSSSFQSGGVVAVTQSVAANQPIYQQNIPEINGQSAIEFDGVNDFLEGTSIIAATNFIVSNYTQSSSFDGPDGAYGQRYAPEPIFAGFSGTKVWFPSFGTYYVNNTYSTELEPLSNWAISCAVADPGITATGSIMIGDDRFLELNRYWGGRIAEIISYNRRLSEPEIMLVFQYLNNKYKIY